MARCCSQLTAAAFRAYSICCEHMWRRGLVEVHLVIQDSGNNPWNIGDCETAAGTFQMKRGKLPSVTRSLA
jgi:hypothetical protein